jgi:hypothetical protein
LPDGSRREIVKCADLTDLLGATDINDDVLRRLVMNEAENAIGHQLVACRFHNNNLDLYCPFRHYIPVMQKFVEQSNVAASRPGTTGHDLRLLTDLVKLVSLPRIEMLRDSDIVHIREDHSFGEFRLALKHALERMGSIGAELNRETAETQILNEEMVEARKRLEEKLRQGSLRTVVGKGIIKFLIGALIHPTMDGMATAGGSASLGVLLDYITARPSKAKTALMHHFLAMENAEVRGAPQPEVKG